MCVYCIVWQEQTEIVRELLKARDTIIEIAKPGIDPGYCADLIMDTLTLFEHVAYERFQRLNPAFDTVITVEHNGSTTPPHSS